MKTVYWHYTKNWRTGNKQDWRFYDETDSLLAYCAYTHNMYFEHAKIPVISFDNLDHVIIFNGLKKIAADYFIKKVEHCSDYVLLTNFDYQTCDYVVKFVLYVDNIGENYFRINDVVYNLDDDNILDEYDGEYTEYYMVYLEDADEYIDEDECVWDDVSGKVYRADNLDKCEECGKYIFPHDNPISYDGGYLCSSCYNEYYFTCGGCGEVTHYDCGYSDDDGYLYCEACFHGHHDTTSEYGDFPVYPWNYRPDNFEFFGNGGRFYGIELECDFMVNKGDAFKFIHDEIGHYAYFMEDGSIGDGIEIVTHPATIDYHNEHLCKVVDKLRKSHEGKSHNFGGIHVHVGRNNFVHNIHFRRFYDFINSPVNLPFIETIAQRSISRWASPNAYGGDKKTSDRNYNNRSRYCAVNLENVHTVEIRIFNGSLRHDRIMKNLQFIDALLDYTETNNSVDHADFITYVANHCKQYDHLYNFLLEKNYIDEVES